MASSGAPCWLTPGTQGMRASAQEGFTAAVAWQSPNRSQTFRRSCGKAEKPRFHEHICEDSQGVGGQGPAIEGAPVNLVNPRGLSGLPLRTDRRTGPEGTQRGGTKVSQGEAGSPDTAHRDGEPLTERGSAEKAATLRRISFSLPRRGISEMLPIRTSGAARDTREGSEGHTRPSCWAAGERRGAGPGLGFRWARARLWIHPPFPEMPRR